MSAETRTKALREAIKLVGSMAELGKRFVPMITKGAVSQWREAPSERVRTIAEATGWKVTPHQLRDDIYPHPDDGLPDHLRSRLPQAPA